MADLLLIFLGACLVNNLVLDHLVGTCPAAALSRRMEVAMAMTAAGVGISVLAAPAAFALDRYLLAPLGLAHLELIVLVLAIVALTGAAGALLPRVSPVLGERFNLFAPIMTVNCAALGVGLLAVQSAQGPVAAVLFGLGTGVGFVLVIILLSGLQERLAAADVPLPFRGVPVLLLALGLLSMAFTGFTGLGRP